MVVWKCKNCPPPLFIKTVCYAKSLRKKFNIIWQTNSLGAAKSVKPKVDAAKSEEAYIKKFVAAPGTPRHIRFLMWWKTDTGRMVGLGLGVLSKY